MGIDSGKAVMEDWRQNSTDIIYLYYRYTYVCAGFDVYVSG